MGDVLSMFFTVASNSAFGFSIGVLFMPQPLSQICSNANVIFGNAGDRPLLRHPKLGALAMEAIASYSNVENFMLHLFVVLLGGNDALAMDIYLSLETKGPKDAAIRGAAKSRFADDPQKLKLLTAILALAKSNALSRDKLAHGVWGDTPNVSDALLLVNPRATITPLKYEDIFVYKAKDFEDIIKSNDRLCGFGQLFRFILQKHVANTEDALYDQLCMEPEIQEKLKSLV